jgi:chromosome segregation ATPase
MGIDWGIVSTIIVAFAGSSVLTGVIIAISTRKKIVSETEERRAKASENEASAAKKYEEAASGLVALLRQDNRIIRTQYDTLVVNMHECLAEMQTLKNRVNAFADRHARLLDVIEKLVHQIKSYSKDPVCIPEESDRSRYP